MTYLKELSDKMKRHFDGPLGQMTLDELEAMSAWLKHGDTSRPAFSRAKNKLLNKLPYDGDDIGREDIYKSLTDYDRYELDMNDPIDLPYEEKDPHAGDDQMSLELGSDDEDGDVVQDMEPNWPFSPEDFNQRDLFGFKKKR